MTGKRVLLACLAATAATGALAFPEGKYREETRSPFRGDDSRLVRTLNLHPGGEAELYSEYRGDRPTVDYLILGESGELMREVREHRKIRHFGTWRLEGRRVHVRLDRLEVNDDRRSLGSDFEFEWDGDELVSRRQDTRDYGRRTMRLRQIERWRDYDARDDRYDRYDPRNDRYDPRSDRYDPRYDRYDTGSYTWSEEIKADRGPAFLVRRLSLRSDGSAELVTELTGSRPRLSRREVEEHGLLFAEAMANERIVHEGNWRAESGGRLRVDLSRVRGATLSQGVQSRFVFEPRDRELIAVEWDRADYGDKRPRFSRYGGRPEDPFRDRYTRPSVSGRTDLSLEADGGGSWSFEGRRAEEPTWVQLILNRDGRFELRTNARGTGSIRGEYRYRDDERIELEAFEADGSSARGTGMAILDERGRLRRIEMRGDARGRRFTLNFTAR
jgi:hypothetical protein